MKVYGLTGGIASGKSRVARLFAELGAHVLDADQIAREVVEPQGVAFESVIKRFGADIVKEDGTLDRARLRERIFSDSAGRQDLNAIVHPAVVRASLEKLAELEKVGTEIVIYEAALLVETGINVGFEGLIVVDAPEAVQVARLIARDKVDDSQAKAALNSQATRERRIEKADFVIDNGGDLADTRRQVNEIWSTIIDPKKRR
jgi:dephospho-CoA kinase